MWEKILLALGGGATTLLASLAQMLHNRKIAERRQITEQRRISEERAAANDANAIEKDRVAIEREASEAAQINEERRVAIEQQRALQDLVRFYRDELAERMRLFDDLEAQLTAANSQALAVRAQMTAMEDDLARAHQSLASLPPETFIARAQGDVKQLPQGEIFNVPTAKAGGLQIGDRSPLPRTAD